MTTRQWCHSCSRTTAEKRQTASKYRTQFTCVRTAYCLLFTCPRTFIQFFPNHSFMIYSVCICE